MPLLLLNTPPHHQLKVDVPTCLSSSRHTYPNNLSFISHLNDVPICQRLHQIRFWTTLLRLFHHQHDFVQRVRKLRQRRPRVLRQQRHAQGRPWRSHLDQVLLWTCWCWGHRAYLWYWPTYFQLTMIWRWWWITDGLSVIVTCGNDPFGGRCSSLVSRYSVH